MPRSWRLALMGLAIALAGCSEAPVAPRAQVSLAGRVLNAEGSASARASVALEPLVQGPLYLIYIATATDGGEFLFEAIPPGEYILSARAEPPGTDVAAMQVRLPGLRPRPPVLRLSAPGSVVGRVTLSDSGALEGSAVYAQGAFGFTFTDAGGAYRLDGVPVGARRVIANRPGYASTSAQVIVSAAGTVAEAPDMVLSPAVAPATPAASRP